MHWGVHPKVNTQALHSKIPFCVRNCQQLWRSVPGFIIPPCFLEGNWGLQLCFLLGCLLSYFPQTSNAWGVLSWQKSHLGLGREQRRAGAVEADQWPLQHLLVTHQRHSRRFAATTFRNIRALQQNSGFFALCEEFHWFGIFGHQLLTNCREGWWVNIKDEIVPPSDRMSERQDYCHLTKINR